MKIIFCLFLLNISLGLQAQKKDYLKYRDELLNPACGKVYDSTEVFNTIQQLESFDTTSIRKNMHVYYEDLGQYYWLAAVLSNDKYLKQAISALNLALYYQPQSQKALWDLAFCYGFLHECEKASYYFAAYHQYFPKGQEDEDIMQQERALLAKCE